LMPGTTACARQNPPPRKSRLVPRENRNAPRL
jgi:hypothetical protein